MSSKHSKYHSKYMDFYGNNFLKIFLSFNFSTIKSLKVLFFKKPDFLLMSFLKIFPRSKLNINLKFFDCFFFF